VSDILIIDSQTPKPRRLATGAFPALSPDGEWIAYCIRQGIGFGQLEVMSADGSGRRQLTNLKGGACHPDWSPDGSKIVFTAYSGKSPSIFVMDKNGNNAVQITEGFAARWSPDGTKLVFLRGHEGTMLPHSIWLINADGTEPRMVVQEESRTEDANWLPNGKGIAFSSLRGERQAIFRVNLDGTDLKKIGGDESFDWYYPVFSPDGKQLVINVWSASGATVPGNSVVLVNSDSHREKLLARGTHPSIVWTMR
jgi:TolB protein